MALTTITSGLTPERPIQITFAPNLGLPNANQNLTLIGHKDAVSGSSTPYSFVAIANVADPVACATEVNAKFGAGSEMAKMVLAAVNANQIIGNFVPINCIPLAAADTDFGSAQAALTTLAKFESEFAVSPYDGQTSPANLSTFGQTCAAISQASRVDNQQFGTIGVAANFSVADPTTLVKPDSQYLCLVYLRDLGGLGANLYSVGELAAAAAAVMASNQIPFNPLDNVVINDVAAPANILDRLSVGFGLESEAALTAGWTPLRVLANGNVAFIRTRTARLTTNGITPTTIYIDVQDFQVLYFWRKTLWTRFTQPDLTQTKVSVSTENLVLGEVIRLASSFQDQGMFQGLSTLAKQFQVGPNAQDRSRLDVFTPVNVIPCLHVIATNVQATTIGDIVTI